MIRDYTDEYTRLSEFISSVLDSDPEDEKKGTVQIDTHRCTFYHVEDEMTDHGACEVHIRHADDHYCVKFLDVSPDTIAHAIIAIVAAESEMEGAAA